LHGCPRDRRQRLAWLCVHRHAIRGADVLPDRVGGRLQRRSLLRRLEVGKRIRSLLRLLHRSAASAAQGAPAKSCGGSQRAGGRRQRQRAEGVAWPVRARAPAGKGWAGGGRRLEASADGGRAGAQSAATLAST
jgi:hypothetical protein